MGISEQFKIIVGADLDKQDLARIESLFVEQINKIQNTSKGINLGIDVNNATKNLQIIDVELDATTSKIKKFTTSIKTINGVLTQAWQFDDKIKDFTPFGNPKLITSSVAKIKEAMNTTKEFQKVTKLLAKAQNEGWNTAKINNLIKRQDILNKKMQEQVTLLESLDMSGMKSAINKQEFDKGDIVDESYYSVQSKTLKDYEKNQQKIFATQKLLISAEEKMKSSIGEDTELRRKYIATLIQQRDAQIRLVDDMYSKMDPETQQKALGLKTEFIKKQQLYRQQVQASYATDTNFFKNLTSGWKDAAARIINYTVIYRSIWTLIKGFQAGVETIKDLNKAFTDIQMVTGSTNVEMQHLNETYSKLARTMGSTIEQVAQGATEWLFKCQGHFKLL